MATNEKDLLEAMETNPSSDSPSRDSSLSPTRLQLGDSFDGESCPSPMASGSSYGGGVGLRGLTHSETSDGLSTPHYSVYNQSARAWMWSRGTPGCKRALSEQSGDGHNHLWHPPSSIIGKQSKRTSAPQVCPPLIRFRSIFRISCPSFQIMSLLLLLLAFIIIHAEFTIIVCYQTDIMQMLGSSQSISAFPRMLLVLKSRRSWPVLSQTRR